MSRPPGQWALDEIVRDVAASIEHFRATRLAEPTAAWLREVDARAARFARLFDEYDIARPHDLSAEDLPAIIDAGLLDEFRYLFGPPVSAP